MTLQLWGKAITAAFSWLGSDGLCVHAGFKINTHRALDESKNDIKNNKKDI